jgi:L-cysteine S-thiosulfotransferase
MRRQLSACLMLTCLGVLAVATLSRHTRAETEAPKLKSGTHFLSPELKALQGDEFANPGMLWVGEGGRVWKQVEGREGKSCASCHGDAAVGMKGVAARYPAVDPTTGDLLNLELRINSCRVRKMSAAPFVYESEPMLSLTAYLTYLSRGEPRKVETTGPAEAYYKRGKASFHTQQGQLNLSCAQCHVDLAERQLRGDVISHGLTQGYPIYRLEWQSLGSLHRRLRSCSYGVRAEQADFGSPEYLALELYLAKRGEGMPLESPAIRK